MRGVAAAAMVLLAVPTAPGAPEALPGWWTAFLKLASFDAAFTQESESAVFGSLQRSGRLSAARGRLRAAYDGGLLLVADGRDLVQYDPDARTAQRWSLLEARAEAPLLAILLDPAAVDSHFTLQPQPGGRLRLQPRRGDLPVVDLEGQGSTPTLLRWTDASGARQVLKLRGVRSNPQLPPDTFRFAPPAGTRWVGGR